MTVGVLLRSALAGGERDAAVHPIDLQRGFYAGEKDAGDGGARRGVAHEMPEIEGDRKDYSAVVLSRGAGCQRW